LHSIYEQKKKKTKKILAKRRAKAKARTRTGMQVDVMEDGYNDYDLFSLSSIKAKKDLLVLDSPAQSDDENDIASDDEANGPKSEDSEASDADSDEERRRYDQELEACLDQAYERFVAAKEGSTKKRKRAKLVHGATDSELWKDNGAYQDNVHEDYSDDSVEDDEANPLVLPLTKEEQPSKEQLTDQWFSQDLFAGFQHTCNKEDSDSDMSEGGQDIESFQKSLGESRRKPADKSNKENIAIPSESKVLQDNRSGPERDDGFEIVPAASSGSSDESSSEDESDYDTDSKAEILAYAKKMLRKKQREEIVDASYNRYTFDDEGLPEWFVKEEKSHSQPQKPITKEEIEAMKAQFKEIDARPAKKVAEAKARKKRVAMKKLEGVRNKANAISDQTDISNQSKNKMIERLYKKAMPKRPKKEYVVAKKGVQVKGGKGKKIVDRRLKKDSRSRGIGRHGKNISKQGKTRKNSSKAGTSGGKRHAKTDAGGGKAGKRM